MFCHLFFQAMSWMRSRTELSQLLRVFLPTFFYSGNWNLSALKIVHRGGRVVRWCWVIFQCWGDLLIWIRVGQGPTALAVGAGGGCLDIFTLVYHFSFLSPFFGRRLDID